MINHEINILGIDPSFVASGFSIINVMNAKQKPKLLDLGILRQQSTLSIPDRLFSFHNFFDGLLQTNNIQILALETPFLGKNAQNFLKLGYLRGSLNLLSVKHKIKIFEYPPRLIKLAVTGYGHADKQQVANSLKNFFPNLMVSQKVHFDATDALAVALCASMKIL